MNNQIAPKQAAISPLAPNTVNNPAGSRTRREHRSGRSERTDSFGSALRRAAQKSRDGRADDVRAVTKARDARRSASNVRPGVTDRPAQQPEEVQSFDRSDERASVEHTNEPKAGQLAEAEQTDEPGQASGADTVNTLNEQEQQAGSAIGEAAELVLNSHLVVGKAELGVGEVIELDAQDLSEDAGEMLLVVEGPGSQPTAADPVEVEVVDSQELAANLATTINLEETVVAPETLNSDLLYGENVQAVPLESSDANLENLTGRSHQPEGVSLGDSSQKSGARANRVLAQQAASSTTALSSDGLAPVDGTLDGSADDLEVQVLEIDGKDSTQNQSSGDHGSSDSSSSDKSPSAHGQAETVSQTIGAARQDGPGNLLAQPTPVNSGSTTSTPIVDVVPEISVADAQVLSAEAQSTDGRSGDAVWRQVQRAIGAIRNVGEGDHEFKIRLTPRELGSVTIDIRSSEGGIAIGLVTETSAASDRLNEQRDQLLQELAESGLDSSSVDISEEGSGFGLDGHGAWNAERQDLPESESAGQSEQDQQRGDRSGQSPRRALGVNRADGSSRLDIAL